MIGFNSQNRKVKKLLQASRQDFRFDEESVKQRVMLAVNVRHLTKEDVRRLTFNPRTWPKYVFGTSLAALVVAATGSLAFAANQSKPGDMLFPVQKLQNNIVLSLPLPTETKAQISTNIVEKRLKELDAIQQDPAKAVHVNAEIHEVKASIQQAASFVVPQETKDQASSDAKSSESPKSNMDDIRSKLNDLAAKHEQSLQNLSTKIDDEDLKEEIEKSVNDIAATKQKLQSTKQDGSVNGAATQKESTEQSEVNKKSDSGKRSLRSRLRIQLGH